MGEAENANAVGDAIRIVAAELRPWMEERLGAWPPDQRGEVTPYDPYYLVSVLRERWLTEFSDALGPNGHLLIADYRHMRNRWAHHVPFETEDVGRSIDSCRRILMAIGSPRVGDLDAVEVRAVADPMRVAELPPSAAPTVHASGHRRMRSVLYRDEQWNQRFDTHVAPVNALVDELIERRDGSWMPYVAPNHGGVEAEIILLLQDPGKMTAIEHGGSGFLSCENDDPSAQVLAKCLDTAGLTQLQISPWNTYPWFLPEQGGLSAGMVNEGLEPLRELLELMSGAHTVVTGGTKAHDSWRRFTQRHPSDAARWRHVPTFHTSGRGITNGGRQTKAEGVAHVVAAFRIAALAP